MSILETKKIKRISIAYEDWSDEDESLLEMVREAGVEVTKGEYDWVWFLVAEREVKHFHKISATLFIQEHNAVEYTRTTKERILGIVIS